MSKVGITKKMQQIHSYHYLLTIMYYAYLLNLLGLLISLALNKGY